MIIFRNQLRVLALVAWIALPCVELHAQMMRPVIEPVFARFEVGWDVRVTPDEAAQKLGFEQYDDDYIFDATSISSSKLTRSGCVSYGFEAGSLWWKHLASSSTFEAVRTKPTDRYFGESITLTWRGKLVGEKLSGELLVTTTGNPIDPKDFQKELDAEREKVFNEYGVYSQGVLINRQQLEAQIASQQNQLRSKRGQGRTVRYLFESTRTQIWPVGFPTSQPATRPAK